MLASQGAEPSGHLLLLLPSNGLDYASACVCLLAQAHPTL